MTYEVWSAVDSYVGSAVIGTDEALDAALAASDAAGLPSIAVSASQGKMLQLLAQTTGARSILEIGTLGGYSTIWLARALPPSGRLISLEYEEDHAVVARSNIARAGFADQVEVIVGPAMSTLAELGASDAGPFDFVFIDADKRNNPGYFTWALALTRPGGLIVVDNVVREGNVADASSDDPSVTGTREMLRLVGEEPRVTATVVQTVGEKGYDGFALIRVVA